MEASKSLSTISRAFASRSYRRCSFYSRTTLARTQHTLPPSSPHDTQHARHIASLSTSAAHRDLCIQRLICSFQGQYSRAAELLVKRRSLSTTAVAFNSSPSISRRPDNPEDPDVDVGDEPTINLTDRAIEQLTKVANREQNDNLALRVSVEPGGCHGYQYKMELTEDIEDDDFRFSLGDKVHLLVDSTSLRLIKGSTIDYVTELIGSQFGIYHNPQAKGAGCGCGVSWEPNI